MKEPTVPWWRRALKFALGGFVGWFRRNETAATAPENAAPPVAARHRTTLYEEESQVKSPSPDSDPVTAQVEVAPEVEPPAESVLAPDEPASEEVEHTAERLHSEASAAGRLAPDPLALDRPAPVENVIEKQEVVEQEEVAEEIGPAESQPATTGADEASAVEAEFVASAPAEQSTEPDEIAAKSQPEEAAAPEAAEEENPPSAEPETPSALEAAEEPVRATPAQCDETTPSVEAASAEDAIEIAEIAAEAAPKEATVPKVESTAEEGTPAQAATSVEHESAPATNDAAKEPPVSEPAVESVETSALAPEPTPAAEPVAAPPAPDPPEPPPLPVPDPLPAPPVTEPPGPDPLPAPVPIDAAPTLPFPEKPQRTTAEKVAAALKARGEDAEQSPFSVIVGQVYDGPLDLLLDLIRKQDIDIYDIPIAKITAQFLAYVDRLRASDMDVAGEFIYTAALLIHIKSKMLLPRAPAGPEDAEEDPRRELVERLLEHERFRNAAQMLLEKQMLEAATWTNPGIREFQEDSGAEPEIAADTTDLVRVFAGILERARNRPIIDVEEDSVTVGQMIQFLARRLTMEDKPVALRRMLSHTKSERALIAMFLALLELVRLQAILLRQDREFSEIFIKKNVGFDTLMNRGLAEARYDWR